MAIATQGSPDRPGREPQCSGDCSSGACGGVATAGPRRVTCRHNALTLMRVIIAAGGGPTVGVDTAVAALVMKIT
jgi:hypothetical protein